MDLKLQTSRATERDEPQEDEPTPAPGPEVSTGRSGRRRGRQALLLGAGALLLVVVTAGVTMRLDGGAGSKEAQSDQDRSMLRDLVDASKPIAPAGPSAQAAEPLRPGEPGVFPLPAPDTAQLFNGQAASGRAVHVQGVVADQGLWVGTSVANRVFLRLDEPGLNPPGVRVGDKVDVAGLFRGVPEDAESRFGLAAEELAQLRQQGLYLHVTTIRPV